MWGVGGGGLTSDSLLLLRVNGEEEERDGRKLRLVASASSLRLLVLLADALLPAVFPLVVPVAVGGVKDAAGQRYRGQILLGDAALPQVRLAWHGRGLRPAVRNVVGAVGRGVVMRKRPVGVAVQPGVGVSVGVWVMGVGVGVGVGVRGGAAVVERADLVHRVHLGPAVVDVQIRRRQVLVGGGPHVTGEGLQGVVPDGPGLWILAPEVTLAQRGNPAAGAA